MWFRSFKNWFCGNDITPIAIPKEFKKASSGPFSLDKLKTALVKTVRKQDRDCNSDSAFWSSFSLMCESEELGVVVLRMDSNNYKYQMRVGNFSNSVWWTNVVVGTRDGFVFLGRHTQGTHSDYGGESDFAVRREGDILFVKTKHKEYSLPKEDFSGGYEFPFELPPDNELNIVSYPYFDDSPLVVIDDDHDQSRYLKNQVAHLCQSGVVNMRGTIWDLPKNWSDTVEMAIRYLPSSPGCTVKLVLVDGNFKGDGLGFNAKSLIPELRRQYPKAILFANSGKDNHRHGNYNPDLLRAGCDYSLPDEDCEYKSDLLRILKRIAEFRPEVARAVRRNLNTLLEIE